MANHLASEKSPYLQEHALNPVDWYPWAEEAKKKARNDGKPIFLSIGYSTCHWCHQMRRESFEDESTAAFINRNFIPIKVDREERPEVDAYYMGAVQAMTGSGGWPLSVFLTPDLRPFYGGTYWPPEPRYGMPSFMQVLEFVADLWKQKKDELKSRPEDAPARLTAEAAPATELTWSALDDCYSGLVSEFDDERGGFGRAPKFPLPGTLMFLLRYYHRTGKELALKSVLKTLDAMADGGIRDHVGGGFHRYSTDRMWLVPHFEKMLYDNALLAKAYAEAYQVTKNEVYALVVRGILGWLKEEMKDRGGGFYSAQDADTDQGEGAYYTWTPEELQEALGPRAEAFGKWYGVTKTGNFGGRSVLHVERGDSAGNQGAQEILRVLYERRIRRTRPKTDTKVMTSWNGLAISAFAFASLALGEEEFQTQARQAADFILGTNAKDGRLLRRHAGGESGLDGTLEDYAFFVQGLLDLFEATSEPRWLREAERLTRVMVEDFEDREAGGFYLSITAEPSRLKESYDGPTPSGNSVAALNLVRLAELTGDRGLRKAAERALRSFGSEVGRAPEAHVSMLVALDLLLNGVNEGVITAPTEVGAREMKEGAFRDYNPDKVVLVATHQTFGELSEMTPLLEGREPRRGARAYVCRNFICRLPVDSADALEKELAAPQS